MAKTILVTGGAGFIGSHLCRRLTSEGHRVISLDNYFTGSRENHVDGVEYREGHTKDIGRLVPESPDLVYHLGEYSRVEQSVLEPDVVHDLNIIGTDAVIAYWQERKCKLVYAGSSTKFGNAGWDKESVPYVATKARNTERIKQVGDQEGLPHAITYFYNVYGPGERAGVYGTVIEAFRRMYLAGVPFAVTRPGTQERNYTHVDDIVDGLLLVAEKGHGDEYGLGNESTFSVLEVTELFDGDIVMLPERAANRTHSELDTAKTRSLGWSPTHSLEDYIRDFRATHARGKPHEKRILVFTTTFFPTIGPAEEALMGLMKEIPDMHFDIVTAAFSPQGRECVSPVKNATIYCVGFGRPIDKYLLPFLGFFKARSLHREHRYLFAWSVMASYGALGALVLRRISKLPLLITLADQDIRNVSPFIRFLLRAILTDADQVYGITAAQEADAAVLSRSALRRSIGEGDAFANQIRYAYADILRMP